MSTHRVAVQMPSFNDAAFVGPAIDSVLAQTAAPFELIVSDDASTDDTVAIAVARAAAYQGPHSVRVVRHERNLGPGFHGEERYRRQSDSPILVNATADDLHAPQRVARLVDALDRTGADLVCSNAAWIDERGAFLRPHVTGRPTGPVSIDDIARPAWCRATLGATFAFRRSLWLETGGFEGTLIPNAMDLLLPLRAALRGGCHFIDEPLVFWRQHSRQLKRAVTDEGVGKSVYGEAHRVLMLGVRIQHIRELAADPRPTIRRKVGALQANLFAEAAAWVAHRRRNLASGYRPAWAPLHRMLEGDTVASNDPRVLDADHLAVAVGASVDALRAASQPAQRQAALQAVWTELVAVCTARVGLYRSHLRPVWLPPSGEVG